MGIDDIVNRAKDAAKDLVDGRDMESLKEDAKEVADIAKGEGDLTDKAKAAFEAVKDPGKPGPG